MKVLCTNSEMMITLSTKNTTNFSFELVPEIEDRDNYTLLDYIIKVSEYFKEYNSKRICFDFYSEGGDGFLYNYMMGDKLSSSYYGTLNVCTLILSDETLTVFIKSIGATILKNEIAYQYLNEEFDLEFSTVHKQEYFELFNQSFCGGDEPVFNIPTQLIPTLA